MNGHKPVSYVRTFLLGILIFQVNISVNSHRAFMIRNTVVLDVNVCHVAASLKLTNFRNSSLSVGSVVSP